MAARRNDGFDDVLPEAVLEELSVLAGRERTISEISGGLTNRNYKVVVADGAYVVRVSSRESLELAINREHEYQNSVRAAEALVPCNNDLLAGNFIDTGREIRLIDYEYAGNNDPCFELGNIWSECHLSDSQLEELVTAYYGRYLANRVARARLQAFMSQYGWTLWASIQDATSSIDFDFWEWGMEKYDRAVALLRSRDFEKLLETVQTNS